MSRKLNREIVERLRADALLREYTTTCRFCGRSKHTGAGPLYKYAIRHYVCKSCFEERKETRFKGYELDERIRRVKKKNVEEVSES